MKKQWLIAGGAALALGLAASQASAQCEFQHPARTQPAKIPLVQAFVACGNVGGNMLNTTTQTGIPSCTPRETYNEQAGSPPNGWLWGPDLKGNYGTGSVSLKAAKNKLVDPLNPVPNTADVEITISLKGIQDADGPASGTGTLVTLSRPTLEDRVGGDMTLIDFAVPFAIPLSGGAAKVKTTANSVLNTSFITSLPGCTSIEFVQLQLLDENGTPFGVPGVFLQDINPN